MSEHEGIHLKHRHKSSSTAKKKPCSRGHSHDHVQNRKNIKRRPKKKRSVLKSIRNTLKERQARNLALFLVINFLYMFAEVLVGYFSNSIGLISDAAHMFVDCLGIFFSLAAMILKTHGKDNLTLGFDRIEILAGFGNGLFLCFVATAILHEAVERIYSPPNLDTNGLLLTSIGGLIINIIGVIFFHEHAHGHKTGDCHHHGHSHTSNTNMQGVFLHILADLFGSVGVVLSSLLIQMKGLMIADPICSLCISALILISVVPLLIETTSILLLQPSNSALDGIHHLLNSISKLESVEVIVNPRILRLTENKHLLTLDIATTPTSKHNSLREDIRYLVHDIFHDNLDISATYLSIDELVGTKGQIWTTKSNQLIEQHF